MPPENQQSIPPTKAGLMIGVALLFDFIGLVLGVANFVIPGFGSLLSGGVSFLGYLTFMLWFQTLGFSVFTVRRASRFFGGALIEAIPIINMLPGVTLSVFLSISMINLEGKSSIVGKVLPLKNHGTKN